MVANARVIARVRQVVVATLSAALLAGAAGAPAAHAAPSVEYLGAYSSQISCDVDAQANNRQGLPGVFVCVSDRRGNVHQFYIDFNLR